MRLNSQTVSFDVPDSAPEKGIRIDLTEAMKELETVIQEAGHDLIPFQELLEIGARCLGAMAILVTSSGKVLQVVDPEEKHLWNDRTLKRHTYLEKHELECLRGIEVLKENADLGWDNGLIGQNLCIPLYSQHHRQGTLLFLREKGGTWERQEILFSRVCALVLGRDLSLTLFSQGEAEKQRGETVRSAVATLSYSELTALNHVFRQMGGNEGMIIASRLADQVGVARSVIVNALRKFESAGIIESRSLGVKGTFIRVLNPLLWDEFEKYDSLNL